MLSIAIFWDKQVSFYKETMVLRRWGVKANVRFISRVDITLIFGIHHVSKETFWPIAFLSTLVCCMLGRFRRP